MNLDQIYNLAKNLFAEFSQESQYVEFDAGGKLITLESSILEKNFRFVLIFHDKWTLEVIFPAILPVASHPNLFRELKQMAHEIEDAPSMIQSRDLLCVYSGDMREIENDWMFIKLFEPMENANVSTH